ELARQLKCTTNLRTMATAAYMYASTNEDYVPRDFDDREDIRKRYFFATRFGPYIEGGEYDPAIEKQPTGSEQKIYDALKERGSPALLCPSVRNKPDHVVHYVVNAVHWDEFEEDGGYGSQGLTRVSDVPGAPAEVGYLFEANLHNDRLGPAEFNYYDVFTLGYMPYNGFSTKDSTRVIRADDARHNGNTTVVFFDGHAEPMAHTPYNMPITLFNPLDDDQLD
ncbi:MAG: DUF1559 domain-containing protein, partial [Phycisphaerae bacterium]